MFDLWHSILTALERIVMLPSILRAILPSLPTTKRMVNRHVSKAFERSLDDFWREVKATFEAPLSPAALLEMSGRLREQFDAKLRDSNLCMLPSYNHSLPTGAERGTYLALDVGGSTFRLALVELLGHAQDGRRMRMVKMVNFRIGDDVRALRGRAFFDWMARRIQETLEDEEVRRACGSETLPMGLSWSFPIEQTSIRSGLLLEMGKTFQATRDVLGHDLSGLIMEACVKRGLNVRMDAIVNDSAATLLSRAYEDPSTRIALIVGTGMNAAAHLPVSALAGAKFGKRPQSWHDKATHVLVNTELSLFGKHIFPTNRWDEYINSTHIRPDFQPLEHLVAGRYLGEIVRLVLVEAIGKAGLFNGQMPARFTEPYALDTSIIAAIESDDTPTLASALSALQAAHPLPKGQLPTLSDILFIRQVCHLVSRRAAGYLAASIHALWSLRTASENLQPESVDPITIGCSGSVIEKYPRYMQRCQDFLDRLTALSGAKGRAVVLEPSVESAIFGAAVAASCLEE